MHLSRREECFDLGIEASLGRFDSSSADFDKRRLARLDSESLIFHHFLFAFGIPEVVNSEHSGIRQIRETGSEGAVDRLGCRLAGQYRSHEASESARSRDDSAAGGAVLPEQGNATVRSASRSATVAPAKAGHILAERRSVSSRSTGIDRGRLQPTWCPGGYRSPVRGPDACSQASPRTDLLDRCWG